MSYKSCKFIQNGISFRHDGVTFCNKPLGIKRYDNVNFFYGKDFFDKFIKNREEIIENCKKGILPHEGCMSCPYVEDKDWDDDKRFKEIELSHWIHCNCACCYCALLPETKGKITEHKTNSPVVQIFPIIKRMIKENMIHPNAYFVFGGGELTVLKEFPNIIKLLLKQKEASYGFWFQTNGIKYEKYLSKALEKKDRRTGILISIDSGSRETFKLLKRRDCYNDVIKNIKHYIKNAKKCGNDDRIISKYIIMPNVNDNREEIDKWIKTCKDIGVKTLHPAIEFCSHFSDPDGYKEKQGELYQYMAEKIRENGFNMYEYDFIDSIIERKSFDFKVKTE